MNKPNHNIDKQIESWQVPEGRSKQEAFDMLLSNTEKKTETKKPISKSLIQISSIAAIFILAFFIVSESGLLSKKEVNTSIASQQVDLPDGSEIKLKANSQIQYNINKLSGKRLVSLKGEAFFEVEKGKTFEVKFPGGQLTVLGTEFNIQAYSTNSGRVDCYSGSVKIKINEHEFTLSKGLALTFTKDKTDGPFEFDTKQILKLPENVYSWNNRPLSEILSFICERQKLKLEAPEQILKKRFSGQLNLNNSELSATILARAMNFDYQLTNNKLIIFEKK